jgi:hypothetical protein
VLGFYDPQEAGITLAEREMSDPAMVEAVLMHEFVHRDLSEKTFGGFFDRLLADFSHPDRKIPESDRHAAEDALMQGIDRSWIVHEGTATAVSLAVAADTGEQSFAAAWAALPEEYQRAVTPLFAVLGDPLSWQQGSEYVEWRILINAAKIALIDPYRDLVTNGIAKSFRVLADRIAQFAPDHALLEYLDQLSQPGVQRQLNIAALSSYEVDVREDFRTLMDRLSEGQTTGADVMRITLSELQRRHTAFDDAVAVAITGNPMPSTDELADALRSFTVRNGDTVLSDGQPLSRYVKFESVPDDLPTWVGLDTADRVDALWRGVRNTPQAVPHALKVINSRALLRIPGELVPLLHCFVFHSPSSASGDTASDMAAAIDVRVLSHGPFLSDPDQDGGVGASEGVPLAPPLRLPLGTVLREVESIGSSTGANALWYLEPAIAAANIGRGALGDLPGLTLAPVDPAGTRELRELLLAEAELGEVTCRLLPGTQPGSSVLTVKRLGRLRTGELIRNDPTRALVFTVLLPTASIVETILKMQATGPSMVSDGLKFELNPGDCALLQAACVYFYQTLRSPAPLT